MPKKWEGPLPSTRRVAKLIEQTISQRQAALDAGAHTAAASLQRQIAELEVLRAASKEQHKKPVVEDPTEEEILEQIEESLGSMARHHAEHALNILLARFGLTAHNADGRRVAG